MSVFSNDRHHPRTGATSWRAMDPETHTIAELSNLPGIYGFQLQDRPNLATIDIVLANTPFTPFQIVTTDPLPGQVYVDDKAGWLLFNIADDGKDIEVNYEGGGTNFSLESAQQLSIADASETVKGKIEIATQAETNAGADDLRAVTPLKIFTAFATFLAAKITGATSKTTPVDADEFAITDSAASFVLKKLSWSNLKATLKSYFDTLYSPPYGVITGGIYVATSTTVKARAGSYHIISGIVTLTADSSALTISGGAGWRYIVMDTSGVITSETIPGGEITADTTVYTPFPPYNASRSGYYSSNNTGKRVIGVVYWDSSAILYSVAYGSNHKKNDNFVELNTHAGYGSSATKIPYFTNAVKIWGADYTLVNDSTNGTSFTPSYSGKLHISFNIGGDNTAGVVQAGISRNANITTNVTALSAADRIAFDYASSAALGEFVGNSAYIGRTEKNDVIRPHTNATAPTTNGFSNLAIVFDPD